MLNCDTGKRTKNRRSQEPKNNTQRDTKKYKINSKAKNPKGLRNFGDPLDFLIFCILSLPRRAWFFVFFLWFLASSVLGS